MGKRGTRENKRDMKTYEIHLTEGTKNTKKYYNLDFLCAIVCSVRNIYKRGVLIIFLSSLIISGCAKKTAANLEKGDDNKVEKENTSLQESIDVFGIVKAKIVKNLNVNFPAQVMKMYVKEGERVKAGEILILLSIDDFLKQIRLSENELSSAILELEKEKKNYERLKSDLKLAVEDYERAVSDLRIREDLFAQKMVSAEEVNNYRNAANKKEKARDDILLSLNDYENNSINTFLVLEKKIEAQRENISGLRGKINLSFIKGNNVVSDVKDGVVYEISYSDGDVVTEEKKLLSLLDLGSRIVEADVPEDFIGDVKIGDKVTITPSAFKDKKFEGTISRISYMAIKKNGETIIPVEISFNDPEVILLPNFNVDISILRKAGS